MVREIKVLVIGAGHMGGAHARAYQRLDGFQLAGLVARTQRRMMPLAEQLGGIPQFTSIETALMETGAEAVAVCSYPDTHEAYALKCLEAGAHVFIEKPIAMTVDGAVRIVKSARNLGKKVVVGYILRHHPAWERFVGIARSLGKPLVMRMNLNQQSTGDEWDTHKQLMRAMSPIVDCGVHYVDVMCLMTQSRPVQVHAIGARLSDEIGPRMYNYGQLQVRFEDGSVGWYEAAWGPMISETAYFIKDVIGPSGSVSMVDPAPSVEGGSSDISGHTRTSRLRWNKVAHTGTGGLETTGEWIDTSDEPDHEELCLREQSHFLRAIREDLDLSEHLNDAVNSLRIVLAADESVRTGKIISLAKREDLG